MGDGARDAREGGMCGGGEEAQLSYLPAKIVQVPVYR